MLQWLIDEATVRGHDNKTIMSMLLIVNFAAIFTTSNVRAPHFDATIINLTRWLCLPRA